MGSGGQGAVLQTQIRSSKAVVIFRNAEAGEAGMAGAWQVQGVVGELGRQGLRVILRIWGLYPKQWRVISGYFESGACLCSSILPANVLDFPGPHPSLPIACCVSISPNSTVLIDLMMGVFIL